MNLGSHLLSEIISYTRGSAAVADTTSETKSAVVDMDDCDGVLFAVEYGDVDAAAVLTHTVKENTANSTTSPTPTAVALTGAIIEGSVTAVITSGNAVITESGDNLDNKTVLIDVPKSRFSKQYAFLSITVATESYELVGISIIKYRLRDLPATQGTGVVSIVKAA